MINFRKKKSKKTLDKVIDATLGEGLPILRFELFLAHDGVRVSLGGSTVARELFCAAGEEHEQLYRELEGKLEEIARWTGKTIGTFKDTELVEFKDNTKEKK